MTDHESRLRAALEALPAPGPWWLPYDCKPAYIAAANPEAIRSLLDELDALRATTSRGDSAKRLSDAPAGLGVGRTSAS